MKAILKIARQEWRMGLYFLAQGLLAAIFKVKRTNLRNRREFHFAY
jgi:hypothetical protein